MNQNQLKKINKYRKDLIAKSYVNILACGERVDKYNYERDAHELKRQFLDVSHLLSIGEITND